MHVPAGLGLPALCGDVGGQARGEKEREKIVDSYWLERREEEE